MDFLGAVLATNPKNAKQKAALHIWQSRLYAGQRAKEGCVM